jgi:hypothetical protein
MAVQPQIRQEFLAVTQLTKEQFVRALRHAGIQWGRLDDYNRVQPARSNQLAVQVRTEHS